MDFSGLKSMEAADVTGKRVLVRADLNLPMSDGVITDATRLERFLPTLQSLISRGAKVIVLSHFGRPKGAPNADMTLAPIAAAMTEDLPETPVLFSPHVTGPEAAAAVAELHDGEVLILENMRFDAREEANAADFVDELAALGDIYVNDAFSCAHRAHASTEGVAHRLPSYAGLQMMAELNALKVALEDPQRPVAAVVGGAKVSTKIPVLANLSQKVDALIIGGGMANTFLLAEGKEVGASLVERNFVETAREIKAAAKEANCRIYLPLDVVAADRFEAHAPHAVYAPDAVPADRMILDIGPKSVAALTEGLRECRTLLWNGPLGAFELPPFDDGTLQLARMAADFTDAGTMVSIAGGGDTVAALNEAGVSERFSYVSTAGGAFLEWLEGRELPGVAALAKPV